MKLGDVLQSKINMERLGFFLYMNKKKNTMFPASCIYSQMDTKYGGEFSLMLFRDDLDITF